MRHIAVEDLGVETAGRSILDKVDFAFQEGESVAVVGPNGSGKTTLMNCILGLMNFQHGEVRNDFRSQLPPYKIGIHLQNSAPNELLKVEELLSLLSFEGSYRELVEAYGLADKLKQRISTLSGGERQKLELILALQNKPEILFIDEITTGLDASSRHQTIDLLVKEFCATGKSLISVTHYLEEVEELAGRIVFLVGGRIVADGGIEELYEQYDIADRLIVESDGSCGEAFQDFDRTELKDGSISIKIRSSETLAKAMERVFEQGDHIRRFRSVEKSLDSLYEAVVGKGGARHE